MHAGLALTREVMFSSGSPDGNITWSLTDENGANVAFGIVPVTAGDVSAVIQVAANHNTLANGVLYGWRDLSWSYSTNNTLVSHSERYTLEGAVPFGVRPDGVRAKLGVSPIDLPDDEIPLLKAYLDFEALVTSSLLAALDTTSAYNQMTVGDGIEALAGLSVLPSLQIRVASSESSGTNQFKRMAVDWQALAERLQLFVVTAQQLVDPSATANFESVATFLLSTPSTDVFPGG